MQEKQAFLSALTIRQDMGMGGDIPDGGDIAAGGGITTGGRIFTGEARL
jgi:hypothetical protein